MLLFKQQSCQHSQPCQDAAGTKRPKQKSSSQVNLPLTVFYSEVRNPTVLGDEIRVADPDPEPDPDPQGSAFFNADPGIRIRIRIRKKNADPRIRKGSALKKADPDPDPLRIRTLLHY